MIIVLHLAQKHEKEVHVVSACTGEEYVFYPYSVEEFWKEENYEPNHEPVYFGHIRNKEFVLLGKVHTCFISNIQY